MRQRAKQCGVGHYLTVDDLRDWAARGVRFTVEDTETGEDVTRILLA
jgi:polyhydroxyalkanoate synthesis regulator protein